MLLWYEGGTFTVVSRPQLHAHERDSIVAVTESLGTA